MARKYTVYWYRNETDISGAEEIKTETLKRAIELAQARGNLALADGVALYDARDVLIGDWSWKNNQWKANVKPKKDKEWHPFGL